jgi:hypothetical protein
MTSIAATGTGAAGYLSPLDRLQNELQSEVSSGAISSTDQSALSTALDDIDQSLKADRSSGSQASGPPSPDQIKSKINDLINGEVQNGTLTSAQATELQNVFANAFAKGGPGGAGGHHGHHHDSDSGSTGSSDSSSSAATTLLSAIGSNSSDGTSSSTDSTTSLIQQFLQSLQDSLQQGTGYSANGNSAGSSTNALVIDFTS